MSDPSKHPTKQNICLTFVVWRGFYIIKKNNIAARRYEISPQVLKYFRHEKRYCLSPHDHVIFFLLLYQQNPRNTTTSLFRLLGRNVKVEFGQKVFIIISMASIAFCFRWKHTVSQLPRLLGYPMSQACFPVHWLLVSFVLL